MGSNKIDTERYSRQMILEDFGEIGQQKLSEANVLIIGCGGLGVPIALYLTAAGIGKIGLVDGDHISKSNLHRQVIYTEQDIEKPKVQVLKTFLQAQNSSVEIISYPTYINNENIEDIISGYDIVIDGSDNFETRYLVNDACVLNQKALIYGAVNSYEGQVSVFNVETTDDRTANYRDIFPKAPQPGTIQNCEEAGVIGYLPGIIGNVMAGECIKFFTNPKELLVNTLWTFNSQNLQVQKFKFKKLKNTKITSLQATQNRQFCSIFRVPEITWKELKEWELKKQKYQLIDVREINEHQIKNVGGKNIPLSTINIHLNELEQMEIPLVFYCQSGQRSSRAVHDLLEEEIENKLYSVSGGIKANFD